MDYIRGGDPFFYFLTASTLLKYWAFRTWYNARPKKAELVGKVTGLRIHPVKSMKGICVEELQCVYGPPRYGEVSDREWMLIGTSQRGFCETLTSKEEPRLNLISPSVEGNHLILSAPGMDQLQLPLKDTQGKLLTAKVLDQDMQGLDCGDQAADWVKAFLGKGSDCDYRLVHHIPSLKKGDLVYGPSRCMLTVKSEDEIFYQDVSPVYLCTEVSAQELAGRAQKPVTADTFRPNLVVGDSSKAYGEDFWEEIFIGDVKFTNYLPCDRCAKTLVDSEKGVLAKDGQPLLALRKYRMVVPEFKCPCFGRLLLVDRPGTIRVGDPVYATVVDKFIG